MKAQNERFKIIPEEFKQIDFNNFSYPYKFQYGSKRKINIVLKKGEVKYEFKDNKGWFNLSDVYYVDLTGDEKQEAVVMLSHVSCGVSCDGGSALFYVYTLQQNKLKPLWKYETGSLAYGCGLKSLTVQNRKISMQLFGRCIAEKEESASIGKFQVKDITRLSFGFNGTKLLEEEKEFISAPERNVVNYRPQISIDQ